MKAVLIPIKPKWCELILAGKKTIEVRKTKPKTETPFKCYIYCTNPIRKFDWALCSDKGRIGLTAKCNYDAAKRIEIDILSGKVIGEFVCHSFTDKYFELLEGSCLDFNELHEYANGKDIYGWCISDIVKYDKPKELSEFYKECEKAECENCPHLHFENTPNSYEGWCEFDEKLPILRPPQSWCYVEELTE